MLRNTTFAILALTLLGCGDELCVRRVLPTCDIRDEQCQDWAHRLTACLRGQSTLEVPPISVISPDQLEARLRTGSDPMMMEVLRFESTLKLLGLLDPDVSFLDASVQDGVTNTAAFYSPVDGEVSVVDRGEPLDSPVAMATLIHEIVHAAQDEETGLDLDVETHEELLRVRHAAEGEAMLYTLEAQLWAQQTSFQQTPFSGTFDFLVDRTEESLDETRSPYFTVYGLLPYIYGARHASAAWLDGGDDAVRRILPEMPSSSATWLADPYATEPSAARLETPPCEPVPAPDRWSTRETDEMGAPLFYAFARSAGASHDLARAAARRWQRDDLQTFSLGDTVALAWRVVFDEPPDDAVIDAVRERLPRSEYRDGVLVILASGDADALAAWTWTASAAACEPPR